jgi:hypothetical protein
MSCCDHPAGAVSALFPSATDRTRINSFLGSELEHTMARVAESSIMPTVDLAAFRSELADTFTFEKPLPLDWLLRWTIDRMEHGIVQMTHRRYFGLFNPAPNFPAQCADRIISTFNPQLASSASSPVPVELEQHVIRAVARRVGLSELATGHFGNGGSEANYTALLCALTATHPAFAAKGARAFSGSPVFYASRECHIAWLKIAHQAGIGRDALRLVETDGHGRMDPQALIDAIGRDRANGAIPVMVAATAGTTGGGMVDPLEACADIAASQGLWYHVDAAWGGASRLPQGHRARGLANHRCSQVVRNHYGLRDVYYDAWPYFVRSISRVDQLHAVKRGGSRPVPQQPSVVPPVPWPPAVPVARDRRLGRVWSTR